MSKAPISIVFKSFEPVETEPGIFEYKYKKLDNLAADVRNKRFMFTHEKDMERQVDISLSFSVVLANDSSDRVNRISHVVYLGNVYEVESVDIYPPRVTIYPSNRVAKNTLNELLGGR